MRACSASSAPTRPPASPDRELGIGVLLLLLAIVLTVSFLPAALLAHSRRVVVSSSASDLAERLFASAVSAFDLAGVYLGDRLGWYRDLDEHGPATPEELAERTGTDARYAREWLEQQAVAGILEVDAEHRFQSSDEHAEVLVDPMSLNLMAPMSRMLVAAFGQLPRWRRHTATAVESAGTRTATTCARVRPRSTDRP